LLALRADPNKPADTGWTPLLSAAYKGNDEIVRMLLTEGAHIGATLQGVDAATLAERNGHTDLAALLRKRASHTASSRRQ
jgi:ankyrin repeat protein